MCISFANQKAPLTIRMKVQARLHYLTIPFGFSSLLATLVAKCFSGYKFSFLIYFFNAFVEFFPALTHGQPSGLVH